MAGQLVRIMGVVEGSIPVVASGGTFGGAADDLYLVEVTTEGPSGTAEITISSKEGDDVAAAAITSGAANNLGANGATFTATFETLHLGDKWTIQTYATGEVDEPIAMTANHPGTIIPVRVTTGGELVVSAELEVGDIEIGAVELKDAATDSRASIEAANTARTTATKVLAVQGVDAAGAVVSSADVVTALGSPAQAGEAAAATAGLALDATLGSPAQAGEAASATAALALESGGNLADIAGYLDTTAQEDSFGDQLTAVGYSDPLNVEPNLYHTVYITIGVDGPDNCDPVVQSTGDGTTWYNEYSGDDIGAGVVRVSWTGRCKQVRIGFTSEHGTTSTLDGAYYGGR